MTTGTSWFLVAEAVSFLQLLEFQGKVQEESRTRGSRKG